MSQPNTAAQPTAAVPTVRQWARSQGMSVGDKGRLSRAVIEAYEKAHPKAAQPA